MEEIARIIMCKFKMGNTGKHEKEKIIIISYRHSHASLACSVSWWNAPRTNRFILFSTRQLSCLASVDWEEKGEIWKGGGEEEGMNGGGALLLSHPSNFNLTQATLNSIFLTITV